MGYQNEQIGKGLPKPGRKALKKLKRSTAKWFRRNWDIPFGKRFHGWSY